MKFIDKVFHQKCFSLILEACQGHSQGGGIPQIGSNYLVIFYENSNKMIGKCLQCFYTLLRPLLAMSMKLTQSQIFTYLFLFFSSFYKYMHTYLYYFHQRHRTVFFSKALPYNIFSKAQLPKNH